MISFCMTTYNGQEFIMKQLTSILSQLSENDEVIISDDGSVDNTLQIIQNINDSRIILLRHKSALKGKKNDINFKRRKCILNFENALSKAKGDIIILSDQDDIWYNNRVLLVGYRRHTNNINNQKTNYSEVQKQKHALYPIHQKIAFRFNTLSSLIKIALR